MKPSLLAFVLFTLSVLSWCVDCQAQGRSSSGSGSSLFSGGGSSFGGSTSASSATGGFGGSSFGQGGGFGGQTGGFGGQSGFGQSGQGLGFGSQPGAAQNGGFVGRTADNVTQFFQNLNPRANQAQGMASMSRGAMDRGREANATQDAGPSIMVNVKLGFTPPARPATRLADATELRLNKILQNRGLDDAQISVQGGVATISGVLTDPDDRLLLARLARLEPGVDEVVDQTQTADELPPPSF